MIKRYGMGCLLGCWLMSPWTVFQWAHGASSEPMAALVALLATTEDETLQRDMLRGLEQAMVCLLYTSPSPRDRQKSRMPSSA